MDHENIFLHHHDLLPANGGIRLLAKKGSIVAKKESLGHVLTRIEKHSDYRFLYSDHPVFEKSRITLSLSNAGIDEVMSKVLAGTGLTWSVNNKDLVIIVEAGNAQRLSPV